MNRSDPGTEAVLVILFLAALPFALWFWLVIPRRERRGR